MKKQLLTATIMLTGMFVLTPSIADAKSSMDSNLKLLHYTQVHVKDSV